MWVKTVKSSGRAFWSTGQLVFVCIQLCGDTPCMNKIATVLFLQLQCRPCVSWSPLVSVPRYSIKDGSRQRGSAISAAIARCKCRS